MRGVEEAREVHVLRTGSPSMSSAQKSDEKRADLHGVVTGDLDHSCLYGVVGLKF